MLAEYVVLNTIGDDIFCGDDGDKWSVTVTDVYSHGVRLPGIKEIKILLIYLVTIVRG